MRSVSLFLTMEPFFWGRKEGKEGRRRGGEGGKEGGRERGREGKREGDVAIVEQLTGSCRQV